MFSSCETPSLGPVFGFVGFRFGTFDKPLRKFIKKVDTLEAGSPENQRIYLAESNRFKIVYLVQGQGRPNRAKSLEMCLRRDFLGQYFILSLFYRGNIEVKMEVKSRRRCINFAFL